MRSLTTGDIYKAIKKDIYGKRIYNGVFPRDKLPFIHSYPASLIVNTHTSEYPAEHWLAIYFDKSKHCEFFDSFGFPFIFHGFEKYISRFSPSSSSNSSQIQNLD